MEEEPNPQTLFMLTNQGRGGELRKMLMREFGIPEACQWFEIRFALGETVTVKCQYMPKG